MMSSLCHIIAPAIPKFTLKLYSRRELVYIHIIHTPREMYFRSYHEINLLAKSI